MAEKQIDRRHFVKGGSALVAGAAATGAFGIETNASADDVSKILNHNPKMRYRRMGKTNLMVSEVSLGGHWKNRGGGRYWGDFANDLVPDDVSKNRTDVISACIDSGINYLDITTGAECCAYGVALKGRREKMYVGADDYRICPRQRQNCNVEALARSVEGCLRRLQTDYLDIWRPQMDTGGRNTDDDVKVVIETFQRLHKAGKVRHLGMSNHSRPWTQHVIETFPEFEMFIFPCTAKTREKGAPVTKENVEGGDPGNSVFQAIRQHNVGLVTIKPYSGGSLFKTKANFPVVGAGSKVENELARLTLMAILTNDAITATVPGLTTVYEVENAARASYERHLGMTEQQQEWLARTIDEHWKHLPREYHWLHDWEIA
jgi:aryl-alcohol dehydrogenase-like predicted oxidoreductase